MQSGVRSLCRSALEIFSPRFAASSNVWFSLTPLIANARISGHEWQELPTAAGVSGSLNGGF